MSIAEKLQTVYDGVEDVRDALQEIDINLGRGTVDTLGDDIRTLSAGGTGYGFKVYGDVRTEEEVEVEDPDTHETSTETEYTYTRSLILDSVLAAKGDDLNTDVIDGIGELDGDMVDIAGGLVQIPLNTGVVITVDPAKVYVKFRDPIVEDIVLSHWGTDGKITLAQVRAITNLSTYFKNTAIETFNEFKWFDGITSTGRDHTFQNCTSLVEVKLPRVAGIDQCAFHGCTSLAHITIPDSFTQIGNGYTYQSGFFQGTAIEEIVIPDSVTLTSTDAFLGMPNLKKIVLGEGFRFPGSTSTSEWVLFADNPELENIENFPVEWNPACTNKLLSGYFSNCPKLVFTPNMLSLIQQIEGFAGNAHFFVGTKIYDFAPNATLIFPNITANPTKNQWSYKFMSNLSEGGYVVQFPNWTEYPAACYIGNAGKVVFSDNVTVMARFAQGSGAVPEFILPTATPPTLEYEGDPTGDSVSRIYVPANSLTAYQAAENWSLFANKIKAYKDPSTAAATFCSIPDVAPIPVDYTKVHYISNIDGDGIKNCQISNLGYMPKRYSQILLDFEHEVLSNASGTDYAIILYAGGPYYDFCVKFSSDAGDRNPYIYRQTSVNANYPNPMGLTLHQKWYYNSHITNESYGQRSTLKFNYHWTEYHGLAHQVDEVSGDATSNLALLRHGNNLAQNRKIKIYRLCMFEPVTEFTDVDDPSQYEIVRDYVPAMRNSDGVYGLYERLTETFYPSTITAAQFSGPAYE